jgi:acyl carrier protein
MTTLDKVRVVLAENGCNSQVDASTLLDDLNIDSLEFMDLVLSVNQVCGVNIPDELVPTFVTIGDLCAAAEASVSA